MGKKDIISGCSIGNTGDCDQLFWIENELDQVFWIEGNVAKDENENCAWNDSIDSGLQNWIIQLENNNNLFFANTNQFGDFATYVLDTGEYIIDALPPSVYWEPCFSDSIIQVFDSINSVFVNIPIDVLVECPLLGLSDAATNLRPCVPGKIITNIVITEQPLPKMHSYKS